ALVVACSSKTEHYDKERRYDDFAEVEPGKASVIGSVRPGSVLRSQTKLQLVVERRGKQLRVTAPLPAPAMLRDGVVLLAGGRITDDLTLDASELRVLVCAEGVLRDPLCPKDL